jgi:putative transposase
MPLKFVARLLEGEKMVVLCREFDISRKTGYQIFSRYKTSGLEGLTDRSRRPYRQGCQLPFQVEKLILQVKSEHPSWGAPKLREKIRRRLPEIRLPAISTVHAVLDTPITSRDRCRVTIPGTSTARTGWRSWRWRCRSMPGAFALVPMR